MHVAISRGSCGLGKSPNRILLRTLASFELPRVTHCIDHYSCLTSSDWKRLGDIDSFKSTSAESKSRILCRKSSIWYSRSFKHGVSGLVPSTRSAFARRNQGSSCRDSWRGQAAQTGWCPLQHHHPQGELSLPVLWPDFCHVMDAVIWFNYKIHFCLIVLTVADIFISWMKWIQHGRGHGHVRVRVCVCVAIRVRDHVQSWLALQVSALSACDSGLNLKLECTNVEVKLEIKPDQWSNLLRISQIWSKAKATLPSENLAP